MNYRDEAAHDWLLIGLVAELDRLDRLDMLCEAFGIPDPGRLERAQRGKLFDVELTFSNLSCVIETKVDSNESGGWGDIWQTDRIANESKMLDYLKREKVFCFLTYGTSEFYTKPYKRGPASPEFNHIKLDDLASLVESAARLPFSDKEQYLEWLTAMKMEQRKRSESPDLMKSFSGFRKKYLEVHDDIDFPKNRFTFCAPELAFPILGGLAEYWNSEQRFCKSFGRVAVYPVERMSPPVYDSVLNFWEMWEKHDPAVGKGLPGINGDFYFEINEDFNLNLKFDAETLPDILQDEVWLRLRRLQWPKDLKGRRRQYKQGTFVLYEWDFGFPEQPDNYPVLAERIATVLQTALDVLA